MATWYTADLHFGHERIIELSHRPFGSVREMDDALVYNWNAVVAPTDEVWVLGDVTLHRASLENVSRLNGFKRLVAGNHDSCHRMHQRWRRATEWYVEAGFHVVFNDGSARDHYLSHAPGRVAEVNLSHFPYRGGGDHTFTERYSEWRLEDDGSPLLCGHVHDAWRTKGLMINVGVDVWDFAPVSGQALGELLLELDGREV